MRPLYLYGPPASGKTTLAKKLAADFKVEAVDLDAKIVERIGMPISQFFAEKGEAAFREIESAMLREVTAPIVALGGGTLLRNDNRLFAEAHGFVAVLDVDENEIARRIELAKGTRPLGDMLAKRRQHYASFEHHVTPDTRIMLPSRLSGDIAVPLSKSHVHRLLIADFLAGECGGAKYSVDGECEDIVATRRCLAALSDALSSFSSLAHLAEPPNHQTTKPSNHQAILDCGESGSTLRFIAPIAAALGVKAQFVRRGRLAERPMIDYSDLHSGRHELAGNVSSQFVTGLLFALPLLHGDSQIVFSSPLESRGYVDMTLDVVRAYGIRVDETADGLFVPGDQRFAAPESIAPEGDWSGAAFWFAANALGSNVRVTNLSASSRQPDKAIAGLVPCSLRSPCLVPRASSLVSDTTERTLVMNEARGTSHEARDTRHEEQNKIDVSAFPDLYPALAVIAAATPGTTTFVNAGRLRIKESDRIAAMESVLAAFGVKAQSTPDTATIVGTDSPFLPCEINTFNDHRIAMAAAIASTCADDPVLIHNASCVAKSYPSFFDAFASLV